MKTKALSTGGQWDYTYDTATISNAKGRLVSVVLDGGTDGYYYDGYDAMGRVTSSRQITTAGTANSYSMSYGYNLAGNMTSETYPSGKQVTTEYDSAGRIAGVKKGATNYYAGATPTDATNRIQYTAHGAVSAMKFGNGKWERTLFNGRLQPTEIDLGASNGASDLLKLEYKYGVLVNNTLDTTQNNGNIQSQIITASALTLTQTYGYDQLNRLSSATESGGTNEWSQTYSYDRYGNRAVTAGTVLDAARTPQSLSAFDTTTNRIKPSVMSGFGYDTSGNLTTDPSATVGYDAENHQTSYGASTYSYDGDGRRVKKQVGSTTTVFVYNVAGQLIAEYDNSTSPPPGSGTSYLISDHLGSTRAVIKPDGTVARHDYLPFGEEIPSSVGGRSSVVGYSAADDTRQKFTQKQRDSESGLDYFGARYYSGAQGRFTSVDPADILKRNLLNPQDFNRYAYVANNPLKFIDPNGQEKIQVEVQTFIPDKSVTVPGAGTHKGDDRSVPEVGESLGSGSFRTQQIVTIETEPEKNGGSPVYGEIQHDTGITYNSDKEGNPIGSPMQASGESLGGEVTRKDDGSVNVHVHGNETIPGVEVLGVKPPAITYNYDVNVKKLDNGNVVVTVSGSHDKFPAHVIAATRTEQPCGKATVVYSFDPNKAGTGPQHLFPAMADKVVKPNPVVLPR